MSSENKSLNFHMEAQQLNAFCKKIISRSRNISNIHEALNVLEAFVSAFAADSQGSDSYNEVQSVIKSHSEKTREKLMQEKIQQLRDGLLQKNRTLLASVYNSISRNGFYQNLTQATSAIDADEIPDIAAWVLQWSNDARQKAEQASGYPDALDFKKAGIAIDEYQTMSDIAYFFTHTYSF